MAKRKVEAGLSIEYVPLSEVAAAERNPKDHDIGAIIQSIQRFGFVTPGVVNEKTGRIVVGHGRADALQRMRADGFPAPGRIREGEDGEWLVPIVRGVEFETDAEAEAYVIADNRLTELGGWDHSSLPIILKDLAANDLLEVTGFDGDDLSMYEFWSGDGPTRIPLPPADPAFEGDGRTRAIRLVLLFDSAAELEAFWDGVGGTAEAGRMTYRWSELGWPSGE